MAEETHLVQITFTREEITVLGSAWAFAAMASEGGDEETLDAAEMLFGCFMNVKERLPKEFTSVALKMANALEANIKSRSPEAHAILLKIKAEMMKEATQ